MVATDGLTSYYWIQMASPKPLFVVGRQRSGTTWVANTLCNHSQVFGIMIPRYYGIKESWFFSHFDGRFGDLEQIENYQEFLDLFGKTTYFRLSRVDKERLNQIKPISYADFFRQFMEIAADLDARRSFRYWLEKSPIHTLYLRELISYYPDARFIGIERELIDVIRSAKKWSQRLAGEEKLPKSFLPRAVFHWGRCRSFLRRYSERYPERFYVLSYEALIQDAAGQFKALLSFLDLEWEADVMEIRYGINTSFEQSSREDALSHGEEIATGCYGTIVRLFPHALFEFQESKTRPRFDVGFDVLFR